jgi:hypothetical protein
MTRYREVLESREEGAMISVFFEKPAGRRLTCLRMILPLLGIDFHRSSLRAGARD